MKKLEVKGRYLYYDDGRPFFYLADTAWELFHKLNKVNAIYYIDQRDRQGFTAIQAVALAEHDGLLVPNAYGRLPFEVNDGVVDVTKPDVGGVYSYWAHMDFIVNEAAKHELFVTLLPTWGDKFNLKWGKGPVIFNEETAYAYGKWIAERYKDNWNIIWMLGGDRPLETEEHRAVMDSMAKGIREVDPFHLITFHPPGGAASTDYLNDADYISFHTAQTGHDVSHCYESYKVMMEMAAASAKPYLDSEPRYEDHPACFNEKLNFYWDADDVRQNLYWDVFAGTCGHTYGNHCVWSMTTEPSAYFPYTWRDALSHAGALQVKYAKQLRMSRDYDSFVPSNALLAENDPGMGLMVEGMGKGYAYIYAPLGLGFSVNMEAMNTSLVKASWFDPRTGKEKAFAILPGTGKHRFAPPSQGKGQDWILILDAVG